MIGASCQGFPKGRSRPRCLWLSMLLFKGSALIELVVTLPASRLNIISTFALLMGWLILVFLNPPSKPFILT